jgi:uncharacterized iron-regulated membrane protein
MMWRAVLFWIHLAAGVTAGAIILVMSATGVALTYEKQVIRWADAKTYQPITASATAQLTADSLLALASAAKPGVPPTSITFRADPTDPATVSFGQAGVLYLNPGTGQLLGPGNTTARAAFRSLTNWHRWLAGEGPNRARGKAITGACNLAFLILVLTGMVLWLPRTITWLKLRGVLWFRAGLSAKAREFNWHNVLGIWSALPLIVIVASGVVISYPWAGDLVYRAFGETPPPRAAGGPPATAPSRGALTASQSAERPAMQGDDRTEARVESRAPLHAMLAAATPLMPEWKSVTLQLPKPDAATASITLDRGTGGQPQHRATVQVSTASAAVTKFQPFDSLSAGRRARNVLRFAHTGEVLGLTGQTLAGLVSLASVVLVYTGIALALRRAARALSRRREGSQPTPASNPSPPATPVVT